MGLGIVAMAAVALLPACTQPDRGRGRGDGHGHGHGHGPGTEPTIPTPGSEDSGSNPVVTATAPRNLLMISIDTLRRDHVDRYAADGVVRMPFLSSLLARGVAFDDHQQCSDWTYHSTSCTLLGRPVEDIGWVAKLCGDGPTPVPDGQRTLAVRLVEAGFHTGLASLNGWLSPEHNNAQGYQEILRPGVLDALPLTQNSLAEFAEGLAVSEPGQRWFLHLHYTEPHPTYSPPRTYRAEVDALPPIPWDLDDHDFHYDAGDAWPTLSPENQALLEAHLRARYDGELRYLDDQLIEIFEQLEAGGWLEDTLVVIWNDHGEQFWEHGHQTHAWGLGAEENDGFLGMFGPGIEPLAWTGPTHAIDLVPTVLAGLGLPVPADDGLPGMVVGTAPPDRPRFASACARDGAMVSVTDGPWKLVYRFDGQLSLWNRDADRTERTPVDPSAWDPLLVAQLWDELRPRADALSAAAPELPVTPPWFPVIGAGR